MPGVGLEGLGVGFAGHLAGGTEDGLLEEDADEGGDEGYDAGALEGLTTGEADDLLHAVPSQHEGYEDERQADDGGGDGLILAVTIVVVAVGGLAADTHEADDDDVGEEVAERMYGIGYHGCRMAQDAGKKLEDEQ